MKPKILTLALLLVTTSLVFAQQVDLSAASKMAQSNVKAFKKAGINKVMFVEFFGEFITAKETAPSVMSQRWGPSGLKTLVQEVELSEDYYETLTNQIYGIVEKIFTENGIEVLEKEVLINNPDYIALGLKEEKGTRSYTGSVTKKSVTTEGVKRSVTGMGMFSETLKIGAVAKIKKMVPKIANDNGCQAAITVKFKYGLGKKNVPTLNFINLAMDHDVGSSGKGKHQMFFFKKGGIAIFTTKKGLTGSSDFDEGGGKYDAAKYHETMVDMAENMAGAYTVLLKQGLQ